MPDPIAGREAGSTGVHGSTGRTPGAAWAGGTGVLGTLGGEGIGRMAFARDRFGLPEEDRAGDRCRDLSSLLRLFSSLLEDEEEDFFFLVLENEEECLPPPSLLLEGPREDDEELLELFRFPEPQAGDGRAGLGCSLKRDLSKPEALPRDSEESWGDLPGRKVVTSTSKAGASSMMSLPSREELSSDVLPGSSVPLPELRRLSWWAARRAISVSRPSQSASVHSAQTRQWLSYLRHDKWF